MSVDNWGLIPSGSPGRWCRTHFGAAPPGRARKLGYLFTDFSSSVKICFQEHYLLQQRHAAEPWRSTLQFSQGSLQKTLHGIQLQLTPPAPRNLLVIGPGSKATETAQNLLKVCPRSGPPHNVWSSKSPNTWIGAVFPNVVHVVSTIRRSLPLLHPHMV